MPKITVSARINEIVNREAHTVAEKRGITFSKFVEIAIINELNKKNVSNGTLAELEDIKEYINSKINDLSVIQEDDITIEVKDMDHYINEIVKLHNMFHHVNISVLDNYAKEAGITSDKLIQVLHQRGYDLNFTD